MNKTTCVCNHEGLFKGPDINMQISDCMQDMLVYYWTDFPIVMNLEQFKCNPFTSFYLIKHGNTST